MDFFDPTCPSGAKWYACPSSSVSKFVGCCVNDPCNNQQGCTQGSVKPVSFNATFHGAKNFPPDASCGTNIGFRTCVSPDNSTTFWGCCKTNACNEQGLKCPSGDLVPAFLDSPNQFAVYASEGASSTGTATSPTGTGHPNGGNGDSGSGVNTGVIVGAAIGGVVAIVAIISLLIFCLCKRRKARSRSSSPEALFKDQKTEYRGSTISDAPPLYSSPKPNTYSLAPPNSGYQYQQVVDQAPQELPAIPSAAPTQRYSELPVDSHTAAPVQRYSELPVDRHTVSPPTAELETPDPSPRPAQAAFSPSR